MIWTGPTEATMGASDSYASLRVLVVDDDELLHAVVQQILHGLGVVHVGIALSGAEALLAVDRAEWDLILCDLWMPGMDGIQFARHLGVRGFAGGVALTSAADGRLLATVGHLIEAHGLRFLGACEKPYGWRGVREILGAVSGQRARASSSVVPELLPVDVVREGLCLGGRLQVWMQPTLDARSGKALGAECLVRWQDPGGALHQPGSFIPVAEQHGLIDQLTDQMFVQAVAHVARWRDEGLRMKVSVNLSMENLEDIALTDRLLDVVAAARLSPSMFTLELTETSLLERLQSSLEVLTRMRLHGFGLSIDDFGTGHSSLGRLKLLPFTELKVDRAFVSGAARDQSARVILASSVQIAHSLGMTVVAEGVETTDDAAIATDLGCDALQGYGIARPMPAVEFEGWFRRHAGSARVLTR